LQLCACLLCVLLMVSKLTKTKPWQSTWRIEWRDELWLPNVWILTLCLFTPTSTSHFFLVFFSVFGVSGCHHQANPFTERTWLSHSSCKSDLGLCVALHYQWPLIDTRSKY
jgi:hypothetical protein